MEAARPAVAADIDRLVELQMKAAGEAAPSRGGKVFTSREISASDNDSRQWLESRMQAAADGDGDGNGTRDAGVWVGTIAIGGSDPHVAEVPVIVGHAVALVETLTDGARLARIEALYVDPEARGVAVGEALMGSVLEWARRTKCDAIDAWALPGDRQTKNFFEANGFSARLLVMNHRLTDTKD